jgi:D-psicose/D-tagatose/L-ribulose 3-epimerase
MKRLRLAYNTNGCQSHRLRDVIAMLARNGYEGLALTIDSMHFDPYTSDFEARAEALGRELKDLGIGLVVETGARFILNPFKKHEPGLMDPDPEQRARRVEYLRRCTTIAAAAGGDRICFFSGRVPITASEDDSLRRFDESLDEVLGWAKQLAVEACLEPEPGHIIETVADFAVTQARHGGLRLALDLGHALVTGEGEPAELVQTWGTEMGAASIEDMRRGEHIHRPFGDGDMDLEACVAALRESPYQGLVSIELSRDSHAADLLIPQSIGLIRAIEMRQDKEKSGLEKLRNGSSVAGSSS